MTKRAFDKIAEGLKEAVAQQSAPSRPLNHLVIEVDDELKYRLEASAFLRGQTIGENLVERLKQSIEDENKMEAAAIRSALGVIVKGDSWKTA